VAKPTLLTIAGMLGVSRTTVSNAFSRPEQLSPELRDRILSAAAKAGYPGPNLAAASLRTGRTHTLGVLFTDSLSYAFSDPVSARFLAGVAAEAETGGYALTIVSAPRGSATSPLSQAVIDGLIVYSVDDNSPALDLVRSRGFPYVLVDQARDATAAGVNVADRRGAELAVEHLIALGHRRLAVITVAAGPGATTIVAGSARSSNYVARERLAGWRRACRSAGLAPPVVVSCPVNGREHGRDAVRLLQNLPSPPTSIACLSDEIAAGVIDGLRAAGLAVPGDVSVIGFDDAPQAALCDPPLSTIQQPYRDKGALAARLLIGQLDPRRQPDPGRKPAHHMLPVRLVVRASTGPVPPSHS
jgi:DNA-binding LacI/PurR family transcriptional regulator